MWPSIDNLSQVIDFKLRAFASSADLAATVIARALHKRLRRSTVLTEWRAMIFAGKVVYKKDILDLFLRTELEYSFKYDGTNVGVGDDLRLRGRKTLIPQDAETYQRVTLDHAKACLGKTNDVKHELMLDDKVRLVIHGELMCNANKFDYSERKLVAKFFAFGATIQVAENAKSSKTFEEQKLDQVATKLAAKGLSVYRVDQTLVVVMNRVWQALLEKHGFEVVETCKKLVLAKIVETHCSWLASSQGEGLVLNLGGQLAKLKSAGEAQHSTPGRLASCMKTAKLCVQEPLVLQTLETMIGLASTSTSEPSDFAKLGDAFASAKTKYDDTMDLFRQGMKPQKVIYLYEQEMLADPEFDTNLAPKVSKFLKNKVERCYKTFKKLQK